MKPCAMGTGVCKVFQMSPGCHRYLQCSACTVAGALQPWETLVMRNSREQQGDDGNTLQMLKPRSVRYKEDEAWTRGR